MAIPIKIVKTAILRANGIISLAAENLKISRTALHRRIQRNKSLQETLYEAREKNIDFMETKTLKLAAQDYWPAIRYYLSTQGKHRGYTIKDSQELDTEQYNVKLEFNLQGKPPDIDKARRTVKSKSRKQKPKNNK